jgi:soluble lytic murein transglycosylase
VAVSVLVTIVCATVWSGGVRAQAESWQPSAAKRLVDRVLYLEAMRALSASQDKRFRQLYDQLQGYVLLPYLDYERAKRSRGRAYRARLEAFYQNNRDTRLGTLARTRLLRHYGVRGQWAKFRQLYDESTRASDLRCWHARALLAEGKRQRAFDSARALWLTGRSQHDACDALFAAWQDSGGIDEALRWQRIRLALEKRNYDLANYLSRELPNAHRRVARQLVQTARAPKPGSLVPSLSDPLLRQHQIVDSLAPASIGRLARRSPEKAIRTFGQLTQSLPMTAQARNEAVYRIGLAQLRRHDVEAALKRLEPREDGAGDRQHELNILARLSLGRWADGLSWIEKLPEALAREERWVYWRIAAARRAGARTDAELREDAIALRRLAEERSFYGFLAADFLGQAYRWNEVPVSVDDTLRERLAGNSAFARSAELAAIGDGSSFRAEWHHLSRQFDPDELGQLARIAYERHWYAAAILTLSRAKNFDDLPVRFPLVFRRQIERAAADNGLEASWVHAVSRQESAFMTDARSPVGARGLMQLMPKTASQVARQTGEAYSVARLYDPEFNLALGTRYLASLWTRFGRNRLLAAAAYNAGPHRVDRWLPRSGLNHPALWMELIPFNETRNYVRRVSVYSVVYAYRRGESIPRLTNLIGSTAAAARAIENPSRHSP